MAKRSDAVWSKWRALVFEQRKSGQSAAEFCRVSMATRSRYRRRLRETGGEKAGDEWVAVEVSRLRSGEASRAGSGLALIMGRNRKIEIGCGFDAPTLVALRNALERF